MTDSLAVTNVLWELQRAGQALGAGKMKPHVPSLLLFELEKAGKVFHPVEGHKNGDMLPYHDTIANNAESEEVSLLNQAKCTAPILNAWSEVQTNGWP